MKWYFASRMRHREFIKSISKTLKNNGHEVVYSWHNLGSLKPYHKNAERCNKIANEISSSIRDIDIFVLISDPAGTDMFIELGIGNCNCKLDGE